MYTYTYTCLQVMQYVLNLAITCLYIAKISSYTAKVTWLKIASLCSLLWVQ